MDAGLIAMRMRLSGGKEGAAEVETVTAAVKENAAVTEKANVQARDSQGRFIKGQEQVRQSTERSTKGIHRSLTSQISAMRSVGMSLTKYVALPLAAVGAYSIKTALDFNQSMALVQTQAGASAKELKFLEHGIKALAASGKTGFTDNELAKAMYAIRSAGLQGAKALQTLRSASDFAEVGQADLAETTKALVSAQNTGIRGTKSLREEMGTLNSIIGAGQMHMSDLNGALSTGFLGSAKALGLNLTEVGGALAFLTREGTPANSAATRLRMAFSLIANPTTKAKDALKGIGLSQADLALKMRGPNGAVEAFKLLNKHLTANFDLSTKAGKVGATQLLASAFGGAKSGGTILQLIGNMKSLEQTTAAVHNNTGKIAADIKKAESTGEEKLKHTWSQLNNTLVELGQTLIPVVIPALGELAHTVLSIAHGFAGLPSPMQHTILLFGGIAAALGPMLLLSAKLLEAWKALSTMSMVGGTKGGIGLTKGRLLGATAGLAAAQVGGQVVGGSAGSAISTIGSGAALGFGVGGPWGAVAGAGLGAAMTFGPALLDLFAAEQKVNPMQQRLAQSAKGMASAFKAAQAQVHNLRASEDAITGAQKRHHAASQAATQAQHALNTARRQSGPNSQAAIHAEVRYSQAIRGVTAARRAQKQAERQHGTELEVTKEKLRFADLEERHRINLLADSRRKIEARRQAMQNEGATFRELQPINERWTKVVEHQRQAHQAFAQTVLEGGRVAGPKYAAFLRQGSRAAIEYGSKVKGTRHEIQTMTQKLRELQVAIRNTSSAFEAGVLGQQGNVLREGIERAKNELPHSPQGKPGAASPHAPRGHRRPTTPEPRGTGRAGRLMATGRGSGAVTRQPVQFVVDKRVLAEGVVEIQDGEDARA